MPGPRLFAEKRGESCRAHCLDLICRSLESMIDDFKHDDTEIFEFYDEACGGKDLKNKINYLYDIFIEFIYI